MSQPSRSRAQKDNQSRSGISSSSSISDQHNTYCGFFSTNKANQPRQGLFSPPASLTLRLSLRLRCPIFWSPSLKVAVASWTCQPWPAVLSKQSLQRGAWIVSESEGDCTRSYRLHIALCSSRSVGDSEVPKTSNLRSKTHSVCFEQRCMTL